MVLGAGLALQSQPFGATAAGARLVNQLAASSVGAVGLRYFAQWVRIILLAHPFVLLLKISWSRKCGHCGTNNICANVSWLIIGCHGFGCDL